MKNKGLTIINSALSAIIFWLDEDKVKEIKLAQTEGAVAEIIHQESGFPPQKKGGEFSKNKP